MHRTRIVAVPLLAAVAIFVAAPPALATPSLTVVPGCFVSSDTDFFGVNVSITGLAPNEPFQFSVQTPTTLLGPAEFQADADGNFEIGPLLDQTPGTFTAFVTTAAGAFQQSATITSCAPPRPTSIEQCKNGGWHQFDAFKNQGDCVSFVATGGRNRPALG
jgi:hypothetical protein